MVRDIEKKELFVGDEVIHAYKTGGYLSKTKIKKITNKSVILENGRWVSLNDTNYHIYKL